MVAESLQTHTPLDSCAGALALAQGHVEELRQWWQNQPLPALAHSVLHVAPYAHNPIGGARGHARQVQRDIMNEGNDPHRWLGERS